MGSREESTEEQKKGNHWNHVGASMITMMLHWQRASLSPRTGQKALGETSQGRIFSPVLKGDWGTL